MDLVVDANVLMSALIKDGYTRKTLVFTDHRLYLPEYAIDEIKNHADELEEKSGLAIEDILEILDEIIRLANIRTVPLSDYHAYIHVASTISPDRDDVPYFALARRKRCAIWSNDKKLKTQHKLMVHDTSEIAALRS